MRAVTDVVSSFEMPGANIEGVGRKGLSVALGGAYYYFYDMKEQAAMEVQARELSEMRGRISKFSLDALMNLASRAGLTVRLQVRKAA